MEVGSGTFGKYLLTEKLATGGMAEIYLAKLIGPGGFEKPLVIKQIHPRLSGQAAFVDMFVAEAKTLVSLTHGNIVPVYELGVVEDTYFIAMEYIDGPSLHRLMARVRDAGIALPPPIAAWIAGEILDGLDYAHRKGVGVIHRDLSPRNVMVSRDGEVKLVDFGIAVAIASAAAVQAGTGDAHPPTGSFAYMSPEQAAQRPLSPQSDLFSVGVLLWEMLTGRTLFARSTAEETLTAVATVDAVAPSTIVAGIPSKLDELVARALRREPGERWQSAAAFHDELQRYLYSLDAPPGARDLAALVAKYSPAHRMATAQVPLLDKNARAKTSGDGGPRTAVVGNRRAPRPATVVPEKTFATNIALTRMLSGEPDALPIVPLIAPKLSNRGVWLVVGGIVIAATAAELVMHERDELQVAMVSIDAAIASPPDANIPPIAAPPIDAAPSLPDAAPARAPRNNAPRPRPAAVEPATTTSATVTATARLKIGAQPWGEVSIDGVTRGRTPLNLTVPAGHHDIVIVFPVANPPLKQQYGVDLAADSERTVFADFSR